MNSARSKGKRGGSSRNLREDLDLPKDGIVREKVLQADGQTVDKEWLFQELVGSGMYANCYNVVDSQTKRPYVCKKVSKSKIIRDKDKQRMMEELKVLKTVHHQNIVKFEHFFDDDKNFYFILEQCYGKNL